MYQNTSFRFKGFCLLLLFLCSILLIPSCSVQKPTLSSSSDNVSNISGTSSVESSFFSSNLSEEPLLEVCFFDVDQADSALFRSPDGKTLLIDAGDIATKYTLQEKLKSLQIERIDILIATHPHSDHIGGMQQIIENFEIGCIYLPDAVHTSKLYLSLLDCIEEKEIPVYEAKAGVTFSLGQAVECEIVAPCQSYEDLNNTSAVVHIVYKDISFLMTGDAETLSETDILAETTPVHLRSTVLKAGHHGSSTSSGDAFLDAVSPQYAIISCGIDNSYGHPHTETLERFAARNIKTFRTDELGDIWAVSDGKNISFSQEGVIPETEAEHMQYVYITDSGKTYHKEDCSSLAKSKHKITLQEAKEKGYTACKRCFSN